MQSRFGRICLSLIVLLLLVIACRPLFEPETAKAAGPVQYKVVAVPDRALYTPSEFENLINNQGKEGWHLVLVEPSGSGPSLAALAVFSK
jgi:hypothetical protein